ncbi:FdhF/YdeP family oxidoreductase [Burkholderia glumae]|uniref:FdhF/YdeP family oxidoreductase n=1 Tax=Burkholderia glumae TaxID=337 RepID=A0AAP9XVI1_BURGL|nr:FdhF/YdeP family oxidoreductase [Burkholderia glumae]ACR31748.1 Oxidoreductase alpha (molybdopterin) subunit [Burkholderia glumae BGR1]AJY62641.1 molybdopterin oxidoreductase family protein [Burkholderia glumae LMG 2196 = ATCC 33617]KHJ62478.1 CbbBc protein [Burkholderia glumae]MCM2485076.1 FdhF/YdeP family oxidoreductase [Burkholderia glumae]MCM2495429.1 FdhF/YdeP family oxidoreductase [Burkholderia glumae]
MKKKAPIPRIEPYHHAAAGWGAVKQVAINLIKERVAGGNYRTLFKQNQPDGFDCPGCAWPDRQHASTFEFCENGVKAVAAEATSKRATPAFFAAHTVTALLDQSDYELEQHGRLTDPMVYDAASDRYVPIAWDDAFTLIARHLKALDDPNRAAFYTSGRASNEAAFLYQLMVRRFGTNNFPDCSNMCHEATSRGLPASVGVGKGTVTLDDFEHADLLLIFGQNPATNHPRMLGELRECAKRGAKIVSINPLRERGLERFSDPQSPLEMLTMGSTRIATSFVQPTIGGDFALIKGIAKRVLELDDAAVLAGEPRVLDVAFIDAHGAGFDAFAADLRAESWAALSAESGVSYQQIDSLARLYASSERVIATWGMGITQHKHSVQTIHMLSNLMLMRGNIGRRGAGLCPVRGHSNVQGNRTVGIEEKPGAAFLDRLGQVYGFAPPRRHGYDVVETIEALLDGRVNVFIGLGGNFAMATPDTPRTWEGLRRCALTVHITTKLNRSHLIHGSDALILPTLGRTEIDLQNGVAQGVTVEDSMSMVHVSYGMNQPASPNLLSETAIVARMAMALFGPDDTVDWRGYLNDYARVRDAIEATLPGFENYNARIAQPGGFHLRVASREREWLTPNGKANFIAHALPTDSPIHRARARHGEKLLTLMTTRSHDQYNTTIYALDDRYRGVFGQRRVVFANRDDLAMLGLRAGERVDLETVWHDGIERRAEGFLLVEYDIPRGCLGAYYPETNPLVPLDSTADIANTPTSKSIPVLLHRSAAGAARAAA